MEGRGGKVFEYLRENANLDLEVPDIAFNVKKSEKTVEAALVKLQQKGLVTARHNEFGRVYWYALPSAPATKALKLQADLSPEEDSVKKNSIMDDEVDIGELTAKAPPSASVKKKGKKTPPPPVELPRETLPPLRNTAKINVVPASPSPRQPPAPNGDDGASFNDTASGKVPSPPPTAKLEEVADFETAEPQRPENAPYAGGGAFPHSSASNVKYAAVSVPMVAIGLGAFALVLAVIALLISMGASNNMKLLQADSAKRYVTIEEYAAARSDAAKVARLETKVAQLAAQVERLKQQQQLPPPEPVKKPVSKGFYRKR